MKCNVCGRRYEADNIDVLGQQDDLWFIKVFCPSCHSYELIAAVIEKGQLAGGIDELTETEAGRVHHASMVDVDDVLDMHNFLKDFDGDFCQLFCENRPTAQGSS